MAMALNNGESEISSPPPPQSSSPDNNFYTSDNALASVESCDSYQDFIEVGEEKPLKISSHTTKFECRFCQHINPIGTALKSNRPTVECARCSHDTPIQELKDGCIFVRCACGWLSSAEPSGFPIQCEYCRKILQLNMSMPMNVRQGTLQSYVCNYCNQRFETEEDKMFWRCPMCNKKSSLGRNYASYMAVLFFVIGLLFIGADAAFIALTLDKAHDHGGLYAGWAGLFIIGIGFLIGGLFYAQIPKSNIYKALKEF